MRCNDVLRLLEAHRQGRLDKALEEAIEAHLSSCFTCSYHYLLLQRHRIVISFDQTIVITIVNK